MGEHVKQYLKLWCALQPFIMIRNSNVFICFFYFMFVVSFSVFSFCFKKPLSLLVSVGQRVQTFFIAAHSSLGSTALFRSVPFTTRLHCLSRHCGCGCKSEQIWRIFCWKYPSSQSVNFSPLSNTAPPHRFKERLLCQTQKDISIFIIFKKRQRKHIELN